MGRADDQQFVHEAVNEALKLEASLARLRSRRQVVLLHYSPFGRPLKASLSKSIPLSGRADWRSRSTASPFRWSCTDMRIAAATKGVPERRARL